MDADMDPKVSSKPCDIQDAPVFPIWFPTKSTAALPLLFSSLLISMYTISFAGSNKEYFEAFETTYTAK